MAGPRDLLSNDDYKNYRNVRAASVLFVVLGSVLVLGGIAMALGEHADTEEPVHPMVGIGIAVVGLAGAIGGAAALMGSRRWAPLIYLMAAIYVFGFPIGTIVSFVVLTGMSRYLRSVEFVRAQNAK